MLDAGAAMLAGGATAHELKATQICAEAGGSQSSFYNIFGDREVYLLMLHEQLLDDAASAVNDRPVPEDPDLGTRVQRTIDAVVDMAVESGRSFSAFAPLVRHDPRHAGLRRSFDSALVTRVVEELGDAGDPEADTDRRRVAAWAVVTSAIRGASGRVPFLGCTGAERSAVTASMGRVITGYLRSDGAARRGIPCTELPPAPVHVPTARNRILDAAEELLVHHDSLDMRMLELNIASDVSVSTIYDEFGSKLGVIEAVLDRLLDDAFAMADDALADESWASHGDLVDYLCHSYALLATFTAERFHVLGAFEAPSRFTEEVATRLVDTEDRLIERGLALSPAFDGDVGDVVVAVRMSKVVLQLIAGTDVCPISLFGIGRDELIAELAVMTSVCAARSDV